MPLLSSKGLSLTPGMPRLDRLYLTSVLAEDISVTLFTRKAVQKLIPLPHAGFEYLPELIVHLTPRLEGINLKPARAEILSPCDGKGVGFKKVSLPVMNGIVSDAALSLKVKRHHHDMLGYRRKNGHS
jgi:hypothetical protein